MDSYKIALPESLANNNADKCTNFCTTNSRPVTCNGLSKDTCGELLSNLLISIYTNFRACASPESYLPRAHFTENTKNGSETQWQKVVLAGVSNMKHSAARFGTIMHGCVDISTPGWTPTPLETSPN